MCVCFFFFVFFFPFFDGEDLNKYIALWIGRGRREGWVCFLCQGERGRRGNGGGLIDAACMKEMRFERPHCFSLSLLCFFSPSENCCLLLLLLTCLVVITLSCSSSLPFRPCCSLCSNCLYVKNLHLLSYNYFIPSLLSPTYPVTYISPPSSTSCFSPPIIRCPTSASCREETS